MLLNPMTIGALAHAAAALVYTVLAVLLFGTWGRRRRGAALIAAAGLTAVWAGLHALDGAAGPVLPAASETLRMASWLFFLLIVLREVTHGRPEGVWRQPLAVVAAGLLALGLGDAAAGGLLPVGWIDLRLAVGLGMAVLGLLLIENLFLATRDSARWTFKHLLIGLGGMFAFDLFFFTGALLLGRPEPLTLAARPLVQVLAVPFILVSAARIRTLSFEVTISRDMALHTTALVGSGVYLLVVAGIGYYLRETSTVLGPLVQMLFFVGAVMVLAMLLMSGQIRARTRMWLARNFFSFAYDYRREWLRFIRTLSDSSSGSRLQERAVRALADVFECSSGALFLRGRGNIHVLAGCWNWSGAAGMLALPNALVERLQQRRSVLNLRDGLDLAGDPGEAAVLGWLRRLDDPWLLVPLFRDDDILGAVVLSEPRAPRPLTWEDEDLLSILGIQVGSYIAEEQASRALFEAQRFERLGQSFSFVAHDLKNLVSQLSLILQHAERHGGDPEFQRDTFATIGHSVERMRALLVRLRETSEREPVPAAVELRAVLADLVEPRRAVLPGLTVERIDDGLQVAVDRPGFTAALENLVQNAVEAAGPGGRVVVAAYAQGDHAVVEIRDNGPGMTDSFIQDQLFRPFASTKSTGYGIGMYQTRETIHKWGGHLDLQSEIDVGTTVRVLIPLADNAHSIRPLGEPGCP